MKCRRLALFGLLALGCAHAKTTDAEKAETPRNETEDTAASAPKRNAGHEVHTRAPHRDPSAVPVASSASGLLTPGAEQQIREKLIARGFMDAPAKGDAPPALRAPLERFQDANNLPATGSPDAETIRKLGLDPEALLLRATSDQQEPEGVKRRRSDDAPE
jgi:peptidoglycan hydrolase-like protein with peptidoglycan-binding domain